MKTVKSLLLGGAFILGLSLFACSNSDDEKFMPPIAPPIEADVENPIYRPDATNPIEEIPENPIELPGPTNPIEGVPEHPINDKEPK